MIQRFTLSSRRERVPHMGECEIVGIAASPEGTFVLFTDYEASQSRVERLEAALTSCRELLVTTKEFYLAEQYRATLNLVDSALTNDAGGGSMSAGSLIKKVPAPTVTLKILWMKSDFMKFGTFREIREKVKMKVQSVCYFCRRSFEDDEMLALGCVEGKGNKLFCQSCAMLSGKDTQAAHIDGDATP